MNNILEVVLLDAWGIDFMGPLVFSFHNLYSLLAVDYVPKWVKTVVVPINDAKVVLKFLKKNIFTRLEL